MSLFGSPFKDVTKFLQKKVESATTALRDMEASIDAEMTTGEPSETMQSTGMFLLAACHDACVEPCVH